jgi:HEAT repeat protein
VRSTVALWIACVAIALAIVPAVWVLAREALRRAWTRKALRQVENARRLVDGSPGRDAAAVARALAEHFDAVTVDRTVVGLLRSDDDVMREWGSRLFAHAGLVDRYTRLLRTAPKWSERTHAAQVLGLAEAPAAVPVLVESLRDPHEDETSVKAAAGAALARLRDQSAIPLFVKELSDVDERSSRNVAEALVAFGPLAVPALIELLADPQQATGRVWASRILGRIGDPRAVDELAARLHDRDDRLRMTAAEALGLLGDARALQSLVRATLRDPAPQVRAHAAGAVAQIEGERSIDVLVAALADSDYATRIRALEAFETMRIDDTSPLETALRDPNAEVRRRAALALERVGYLERTVAQLSSEDRAVRSRAYSALLEIGQVGLVESVAGYVHHPSFEVRAVAARACGELGATRIAPILLRAIDDDAWPVRAAVCGALGHLRTDDAVAPLVRTLGDGEDAVREAAAEALTSYSPEQLASHIDALAMAYDRGTVAVRKSTVVMAGSVGGQNAEALLVRASVDPSDTVRLAAVIALGHVAGDSRVEPLVLRLTDASIDVRMAAVTALGTIDRVEAFDGLLRALPGAPRTVRDRIAEALARGARALLFERLAELERNASMDVRLGVAWTLGKIGDPTGIATLGRYLRDLDSGLRASAAGALAKISHPAAIDALLGAAEDPDGRVRAAVVNALGRIGAGDERVVAALDNRARDPDAFVRNRAIMALARAGRERVEARVRHHAERAELSARLVAYALVGSEAMLTSVIDALAAPGGLDVLLAFLDREEPAVRASFFGALCLDDPALSQRTTTSAPELLSQYEKTLRTSLDVATRRLAVIAIERIDVERGIPVLADAATGDPNETVRLRATAALALQGSDQMARRGLIRAASDPNSDVAIVAARAIAMHKDPEVLTALLRRLGAGSDAVQEVVEEALADLYRDDPTSFADWMMGVDVPDRLTPAVRVLARMASPATLPLLRELLRSSSASVRAAAVGAIANLDVPDAASSIDDMAEDPSEDVRLAVVEAIQWNANSLTRWARLRRDPSVRVRVRIVTVLERAHGPSAKSAHRALEGMLGDGSPLVRAAALASLAASPDPDGLRAFGRLWPQAAPDTRGALRNEPRAVEISDRVTTRLSSSSEPAQRRSAVVALAALAVPGYASRIIPALRDPSPDVRIAAIHALAAGDDADARARIAEMLADPEATVQEAARRSLLHTVG